MKVTTGSALRFSTLAVVVVSAACSDSGTDTTPVSVQVIEETVFAPALAITLADMTRSATGLYVQTREPGTGDMVAAGDSVTVAYQGFLTTGDLFDAGNFPLTLGAGRAIPGFDEGVRGMRPGEKRVIVIPPALAYGNQGSGQIPPGSILIFELELVAIH